MIPVVALVGRPNVGKSTLFNWLTRTRDALVADFPGLTRDRKYGHAKIEDHVVIVIDTGGIDGKCSGMDATKGDVEIQMAGQAMLAIEEADIVLFMVDARAGLMPADVEIAQHLRNRKKATVLVANKTDGMDPDTAVADFHALGLGEVHAIAASHGRGVAALFEQILLPYEKKQATDVLPDEGRDDEKLNQDKEAFNPQNLPIKLAIVGRPNVGKSTLINRILGEDRVIVCDMPGTTRDSIFIPMVHNARDYVLIDTAGVRRRAKVTETVEKFSVIKTLQSIETSNVVVLVIDSINGISDQDLSLLGFILNSGRSLVIAVNKWDGLAQEERDRVKAMLDFRLGFVDFARVHFISALQGSGVHSLFTSIREAYDCSTKRVSTSRLTRIMQMAEEAHQPPLVRGRRVKLKYAHAGGYNPPLVVIHGNQVASLTDSYKRYLMNYFRRSLKIMGAPIRIQLNESNNPFVGRSDRQTHKRQRPGTPRRGRK